MREDLKERVSTLEAAKSTWILKSSLDGIEADIQILMEANRHSLSNADARSIQLEQAERGYYELKDFLLDSFATLQAKQETINLLFRKLPKQARVGVERSKRDLKREVSVLLDHLDPVLNGSRPDSLEEFEQQSRYASGLVSEYAKAIGDAYAEERYVLALFEREAASSDRHLRTIGYLSVYLLYPLGVLIGILGQVAGIKTAGER